MIDSLVFSIHLKRKTMLPTHFNRVAIDHDHKNAWDRESHICLVCAIGRIYSM